ncbi:Tll0287-like domain-containing protein [Lutibacter sp.]
MLKKALIISVLLSVVACNNTLSTKEKQEYSKMGMEITKASFKELSSNLIQQMKIGGPSQAVPFCNVQAMPITYKMAEKFNVTIKRTSDKVRNSKNKASKRELEIIKEYSTLIKNNEALTPIVELDENNMKHYYAPIKLNAKCLACHGELGNKLSVKTDSLIKSLYPNDKAIGYKDGNLRGVWSITFKN